MTKSKIRPPDVIKNIGKYSLISVGCEFTDAVAIFRTNEEVEAYKELVKDAVLAELGIEVKNKEFTIGGVFMNFDVGSLIKTKFPEDYI